MTELRYIAITLDAIRCIVMRPEFQTPGYESGRQLFENLTKTDSNIPIPYLRQETNGEGKFIFTDNPDIDHVIVIDYDTASAIRDLQDSRFILMLQNVLRYAVRYYDRSVKVKREHEIPDSNLTIVYPFPFVARLDSEKVLIERQAGKLDRKGKDYLLVYYLGTESFETPNTRSIGRVFNNIREICVPSNKPDSASLKEGAPLVVTNLPSNAVGSYQSNGIAGLENWLPVLTSEQKEFVLTGINGPERLEGAAGTGKTLSMVLRCINLLKKASEENAEMHIAFITHSAAIRECVKNLFLANYPEGATMLDRSHSCVSLTIATLQEWCQRKSGYTIPDTELLDRNAEDSKGMQLMFIEDVLNKTMEIDYPSYEGMMSAGMKSVLSDRSNENLLRMLQHEIAVTIKGRAKQDLAIYKQLKPLKYALPCKTETDKSFVYALYNRYQQELCNVNSLDTDDVVLTAAQTLDTPIWRRRRQTEGFDVLFVDETHLFNLNELNILHFLCKSPSNCNIVFAIDKSQAVGNTGLDDEALKSVFMLSDEEITRRLKLNTMFRCSPAIMNLAFKVLTSGATLFSTFENPMENAMNPSFTYREEELASEPEYRYCYTQVDMVQQAFTIANILKTEKGFKHERILLAAANQEILDLMQKYAQEHNITSSILKSRATETTAGKALMKKYVMGLIEYVGGLEFDAVILVGVDKDTVPPKDENSESMMYARYAWHNLLYVAITRAKYALYILGLRESGASEILESSIESGVLTEKSN